MLIKDLKLQETPKFEDLNYISLEAIIVKLEEKKNIFFATILTKTADNNDMFFNVKNFHTYYVELKKQGTTLKVGDRISLKGVPTMKKTNFNGKEYINYYISYTKDLKLVSSK